MSPAPAVLLSLGGAVLYALTSVLQQSAAATVSHQRSMRPGLLVELLRRPRWLLGITAELGAYAMHFLALRRGSLLLVQTVLVSGLLFALPIGAALERRKFPLIEWLWAVVVVGGLAAGLAVATPTEGYGRPTAKAWTGVLTAAGTAVALLITIGKRRPGSPRAARLGAAAGILFGVGAALTKASADRLNHGLGNALASWEPYVLVGVGALGLLLCQSAFQAGPLRASLPVLTVANPLVAAVIAVLAFHDQIASTPLAVVIELGSVAAMVIGVWGLARFPLPINHTDQASP